MGFTLGGAFNLGSGENPGFSVGTLGSQCLFVDRVQRGRSAVAIGDFVSPVQVSMLSWRAFMAWSWASTVDVDVFFSAAVSCCFTF